MNRRHPLYLLLLFCLSLLCSQSLWAGVELPRGIYHQSSTELSVQTQAGAIDIVRTWYDNRWHINRAWNRLVLEYNSLDGSVKAIGRNEDVYERVGQSPVYRFDETHSITQTDSGFRWQNSSGDWIDYDAQGLMLSYGYKTVTKGTLVRTDGLVTQVKDTRDRVIYTYHYAGGQLQSISDNSIPARSVSYHYTGEQLTKVTDVLGYDTLYAYSGSGDKLRMKSYTNAENHQTTISYSTTGNVASVLDEKLIGYKYGYDYDKVKKEHYTIIRHTSDRTTETWYNQRGLIIRQDINGETIKRIARDSAPLGSARSETVTDRRGLNTVNAYDAQDNLLKRTLSDGSVLSYQYGSYANVTQSVDERGIVSNSQFSPQGYLQTRTEAQGTPRARTITYTHNDYGQQTSMATAADDHSVATLTLYEYDPNGNLIKFTDAEGRITTYDSHDNMGNVKSRTTDGKTTTYTYNDAGWLIEQKDPLNRKTQYDYDKLGNLIQTRYYNSDGTLHSQEDRTYTYRSELASVTDASGHKTSYYYDSRGNLIEIRDAANHSQFYDYDLYNRRIKRTDANGNVTKWLYGKAGTLDAGLLVQVDYPTYTEKLGYNNRGWVIQKQQLIPAKPTQTSQYTYDLSGNLIKQTDAKNRSTQYEYDELGRQSLITDADTGETRYVYDNRDNIVQVIDANGHTIRSYAYDKSDLNISETKPEGQSDSHSYNARGLLATSTDGEGQRSKYTYNDADQLEKIERFASTNITDIPDKTITFTYNKLGLLESYNDGISSGSYLYDENQRKISETVTYKLGQVDSFTKTHQYSYDSRGNKASFTDPQGVTFEYFYNKDNQLVSLVIPTVGSINFTAYQWQAPKSITLPGGHKIDYQYDGLLRPELIKATDSASNAITALGYEYDVVNNITKKVTDRGAVDYGYDALDRLLSVDYAEAINTDALFGQGDEHFSYDKVGNRLSDDKTAGAWGYNQNNELQGFDDTTFKYNLNGQMVEKTVAGVKTSYSYNLDGRLKEIRDNAGVVVARYEYDPFGRRTAKYLPQSGETVYFYYSKEGLIGEYDELGSLIQSYGYRPNALFTTNPVFTHRLDFAEEKGYAFYLNDHLGTPKKLILRNGRKVWGASADAFGKTVVTKDEFRNPLRFPGQYEDNESSLYYNWFRFYDYQVGRYITSDPLGLNAGPNEFLYAHANSTVFFDYLGLLACDYYAAEDYVKKKMKKSGFRLPKEYERRPPKPGETHSGYYDPDTDIVEVTDEHEDYCLDYNAAKDLLNTFIHETLHANQTPNEIKISIKDGPDADEIHKRIYEEADLLTEEWMEEFEKYRKEECGDFEDCSCEWSNPTPRI